MRIDVIVFDGFDELDAVAPYEVLSHAAAAGADFDVAYAAVGAQPGDEVTAAHGTVLRVQRNAAPTDLVVVAGGGWDHGPSRPGAAAEAASDAIGALVREQLASGGVVASVCTGGMILAASGVLRGRRATTHHRSIDQLPAYGAEAVRERVVDDGDVVTSGGVTSGIDLALHLAERFGGAEYADVAQDVLEHSRTRASV